MQAKSSSHRPWTRDEMAARVAGDIPDGSYVNLGIGMPVHVARFLAPEREVVLHSENGILGMGPPPAPGQEDPDLINAGKLPATLVPGGAYFHHADSFAMMRGGHLDLCVMGGMQVADNGDLANWSLARPGEAPAVGGAMDLAVGARRVYILMEHNSKSGAAKLLRRCTLPLTGRGVVDRIYTDLAVIDVTPAGFCVRAMAPGVTLESLQALSDAPLHAAPASDAAALPACEVSTPGAHHR
ncbi:3-oxoadipate CoA-transferase [Bordetella genomosp. 5]|uniref:3-oxoadipate CoA-transferase n=1 Tax=Bordetella genomosp. 5 TaxID=1395608 RepID=A0A261THM7_9BORD|nr:3-oxoacid CoA-transferase subunit B [Bordetella genomosp. 5]OZI42163.1 3-oxoadipate CoA-transferase [Bordetella genomosp. 5]OZI49156.1 3-oxoadipate CoA-transferase [Bordetella genomosp. 5]